MYPDDVQKIIDRLESEGCRIMSVDRSCDEDTSVYGINYIFTDRNLVHHFVRYWVPVS